MEHQRSRNAGLVPMAVPGVIAGKTVAIAGTGGVGGVVSEHFVRQCKVRRVKLADLDEFTLTNLNRQSGALHSTLGLAKVNVTAARLADIDPELEVVTYRSGVQPSNLDEFLDDVDLVLDAVDYGAPEIHLTVTRRARQLGIPVVMGIEIAYGARAIWFSPEGQTFEQFFRLGKGDKQLALRHMIMRLPSYLDLNALKAVSEKSLEAPAIATGGAAVAALLVPLMEAILSGVDVPAPAPAAAYIDVKERKAGVIKHRDLTWWSSVAVTALRNRRGRIYPAVEGRGRAQA